MAEVKTEVKSLKVTRLSTLPNKNGSYAYLVEENDAVRELFEQVEGVYDGREGGKIIYSRSRLGSLNKAVVAQIRIVEQMQNNEGTGRHFINLVDNNLEDFGNFAEKVKLAERFGIQNSAAAVAAFFGVQGKVAQAQQAEPLKEEGAAKADPAPMQNAGA